MTTKRILVVGHARFNQSVETWFRRFEDNVVRIDVEQENWEQTLQQSNGPYDLIFDTVSGPTELKRRIVQALDRLIAGDCYPFSSFVSHTITEIASWSTLAKRWIGYHPLHFDRLKRLECSLPLQGDQALPDTLQLLFRERDKTLEPIQDVVAGVFPRTLALLVNEAVYAWQEGVATAKGIDTAMKKGTNYPLGPLEWADVIGLEHILFILKGLQREYGDDRYRPAPLLQNQVRAMQIGSVSGEGFDRS